MKTGRKRESAGVHPRTHVSKNICLELGASFGSILHDLQGLNRDSLAIAGTVGAYLQAPRGTHISFDSSLGATHSGGIKTGRTIF